MAKLGKEITNAVFRGEALRALVVAQFEVNARKFPPFPFFCDGI